MKRVVLWLCPLACFAIIGTHAYLWFAERAVEVYAESLLDYTEPSEAGDSERSLKLTMGIEHFSTRGDREWEMIVSIARPKVANGTFEKSVRDDLSKKDYSKVISFRGQSHYSEEQLVNMINTKQIEYVRVGDEVRFKRMPRVISKVEWVEIVKEPKEEYIWAQIEFYVYFGRNLSLGLKLDDAGEKAVGCGRYTTSTSIDFMFTHLTAKIYADGWYRLYFDCEGRPHGVYRHSNNDDPGTHEAGRVDFSGMLRNQRDPFYWQWKVGLFPDAPEDHP